MKEIPMGGRATESIIGYVKFKSSESHSLNIILELKFNSPEKWQKHLGTRMSKSVSEKIIATHVAEGKIEPGEQIGLRIDHTLTQD